MTGDILRIAHFDTEQTWRGGQQQLVSLIEGLNFRGHKNLAVIRDKTPLMDRLKGKASVMPVRPWGEWDFISAHFVNRRLKRDKIDVAHAHSGHAVSLAVLATWGSSIPVVVTRRVDFPLSSNIFSKWKYARPTRIVAISKGVKRILMESGVPPEKIDVVHSGIDFNKFSNISPVPKGEFGFLSGNIIIGQVAALAPHKDQATLLRAMALLVKRVPQARCVILGEGELRSQLEARIRELRLDSIVRLLGFKKNPLDYVASFDVFCLSSREEGLGTSLLDAMVLKIPIVATDVGGIPEVVQPGITGILCSPQNPNALAESLESVLISRDLASSIVARAALKAKEFDIAQTVSKMETLYRSLVRS